MVKLPSLSLEMHALAIFFLSSDIARHCQLIDILSSSSYCRDQVALLK